MRTEPMAYESNLTNSAAASGQSRIAAFFLDLGARVERYRAYTKTLRELNALSNRELDDLGLSRSEITRIARQAAHGM